MSNYYAPCFYRINFFVILSYIELPWFHLMKVECHVPKHFVTNNREKALTEIDLKLPVFWKLSEVSNFQFTSKMFLGKKQWWSIQLCPSGVSTIIFKPCFLGSIASIFFWFPIFCLFSFKKLSIEGYCLAQSILLSRGSLEWLWWLCKKFFLTFK